MKRLLTSVALGLSALVLVPAAAGAAVVTTASPGGVISEDLLLSDQATVDGLVVPTAGVGTVTFELFGPDDDACGGTPVFTSTVVLTLNDAGDGGTATSAEYTPLLAGTYRWVASYSGDVNNARADAVAATTRVRPRSSTRRSPRSRPSPRPAARSGCS